MGVRYPPPQKKPPRQKNISKIICSQFKFRLITKKNDLKNFKKMCLPPKKIIPPPQKKFQKIIFSQFQFRIKTKNWLKKIQRNLPPPKKIPLAKNVFPKNYFFTISLIIKKIELKKFKQNCPPLLKKSPCQYQFQFCQPKL